MATHFTKFLSLILISGFLTLSCNKITDEKPVPEWENTGADSCALNVVVQTQQGLFLSNSYVNLAFTQDSLNQGKYIRRAYSNGVGKAIFRRLYSRKFYSNCFTSYQGIPMFGSMIVFVPPYITKDTILKVN